MIGIGIDTVELNRMRDVLERTPSFRDRVFAEEERAYAATHRDPVATFAARFAAKEAVMKSLGVGIGAFDWKDVVVIREPTGRPRLELRGKADELAKKSRVQRWHLSLTHDSGRAMAMVVAE